MSGRQKAGFSHVSRRWIEPGEEPALRDMLADPLLHLVMRRDGVSMTELCNRISHARERLGLGCFDEGPCRCAA